MSAARTLLALAASAAIGGCVGSNSELGTADLDDVERPGAVVLDPIPEVVAGRTCSLSCSTATTLTCQNGDGCCPSGCDTSNDDDCAGICGNGVLEGNEKCDTGIPAGSAGACPGIGTLTLTFEDGPSPYTRDIVDTLRGFQVQATFFWLGSQIEGRRDVVRYAADQGHQIANHSFYHHRQVLLDRDEFVHRLRATKDNIGDFDGGRLYYRFPYGQANDNLLSWLVTTPFSGSQRYVSVGWNIDSADFDYGRGYPERQSSTRVTREAGECGGRPNPFVEDYVGWVQFITRRTRGGVLLFHDTQRITREYLGEIITYLRDPITYWAELRRADADRATRYEAYYRCMGVDTNLSFKLESLYGGTWPSFVQGKVLECETPYNAASYPTASTSFTDVKAIFDQHGCAALGCHPGGGGASGYSTTTARALLAPGTQARISEKCGVARGDPNASYLIDKLRGLMSAGRQMPLDRPALTAAQLDLVTRWVSEGAPP